MNEALRVYLSKVDSPVTEEVLRHILREEMPEYLRLSNNAFERTKCTCRLRLPSPPLNLVVRLQPWVS